MSIDMISTAAQRTRALSLRAASARFAVTPVVHVPADLGRGAYNAKGSPPRGNLC